MQKNSDIKYCPRCKTDKPHSEFHRKKSNRDGLNWMCKVCGCAHSTKYRNASIERYRQYDRDRYANDATRKAACIKRAVAHQDNFPKMANRRKRKWEKKNPHVQIAKNGIRGAKKRVACPSWRNTFFISEIYSLARLRNRVTGIKWHVDHIVPLRHPLVCGLHCEFNLRVIPALDNIAKGNRTWPDMP